MTVSHALITASLVIVMLYSETLMSPLSELYVSLSPFLYSHSSANVLIPLTTHLTAALTGSLYNSILLVSIAEKYFEILPKLP